MLQKIADKLNAIFSFIDMTGLLSPLVFATEEQKLLQKRKIRCGFHWRIIGEEIKLFFHESSTNNSSYIFHLGRKQAETFFNNAFAELVPYLKFELEVKGNAFVVTCLSNIPIEVLDKKLGAVTPTQPMEVEIPPTPQIPGLTAYIQQSDSPVFKRPLKKLRTNGPVEPDSLKYNQPGKP